MPVLAPGFHLGALQADPRDLAGSAAAPRGARVARCTPVLAPGCCRGELQAVAGTPTDLAGSAAVPRGAELQA
eukprot:7829263-Alexandrium_andersonii.AAC.1